MDQNRQETEQKEKDYISLPIFDNGGRGAQSEPDLSKAKIPTGSQGSLTHPLGAGIQKPPYPSPPMHIEPPKAQTYRFLYNTATPQVWFPSSSFKFDEMWKPNAELTSVIKNVYKAVRRGIYPERIGAGSSGSYLVKNTDGKIIAVY